MPAENPLKLPGILSCLLGALGFAIGMMGVATLEQMAEVVKGPNRGTIWTIELIRSLCLVVVSIALCIGGFGLISRKVWGKGIVITAGFALAALYAFYLLMSFTYIKSLQEGASIGPNSGPSKASVSAGVILFGLIFLVGGIGVALVTLFGGKSKAVGTEENFDEEEAEAPPAKAKPMAKKAK